MGSAFPVSGVIGIVAESPEQLRLASANGLTCVEVRADGEIIILDAGSGIRPLGLSLVKECKNQPIELTLRIIAERAVVEAMQRPVIDAAVLLQTPCGFRPGGHAPCPPARPKQPAEPAEACRQHDAVQPGAKRGQQPGKRQRQKRRQHGLQGPEAVPDSLDP